MTDKYDTIIIGAGIGGLICGTYLAKNGMKVLIIQPARGESRLSKIKTN